MSATIIISEKSKAAQAIADALGSKKTIREGKISIYHVPSKDIYVVPLRGHIMQYENSGQYKKWDLTTNRDIITDSNAISKIPSKYSTAYIRALKKYAKLSNRCINACDADVEGCNIGLIDAYTFVKQAKKNIKLDQMWLNTLQKKDIVKAYNNTIPPKWEWAYSGESRAKIDAIIGFSATREVSLTLKPILKTLGAQFTSIGRVQTSLLYLLYLREELIRNFKPEKYWALSANITPLKENPQALLKVTHVKSPFKDEKIAEQTHNKVKDEKIGEITKIKKNPKKVMPPTPLNTSKALMLITRKLRINASLALKTMESLYLNKIISYPRTDSDKYPDNFDHIQYLQKLIVTNTYGKYTQYLFSNQRITPHQGKVWAGDHPPITPILGLDPGSSKFENDLQKKVYNLITRNYLATFGEPAEEVKTSIYVEINGELFLGRLNILVKEGFFEIAPFLKPKYDIDMAINQGKVTIKKINFEEKESQPPPRYTDTTLLKLMEQKKLGTKSTRPTHIETLIKRLYIKRMKRQLFVLELGYVLIDSLISIWEPFLNPNFTKTVEMRLKEIEEGKRKMDDVVDEVKTEFLALFDKFRKNKPQIMKKMEILKKTGNVMRGRDNKIIAEKPKKYKVNARSNSIKISKNNGKNYNKPNANNVGMSDFSTNAGVFDDKDLTTSMCPVCKQTPMKLVITRDRKKFFACISENCKTYLPIPKKGSPRLLKGKCQLCGFNIIKISGKNKNGHKMQYYVCSNCWQKSFDTQEKIGMCFNCEQYHVENGKCKRREIKNSSSV